MIVNFICDYTERLAKVSTATRFHSIENFNECRIFASGVDFSLGVEGYKD